ncbi:choice-of-anchor Q domain-containing protein [Methylomonas sp. HYX-M1]|uniref:choice-of-anchor Q domain-containing protein n=1 Tax=Methylomonas sp. HYX-M1 TaxID=3139307 RepID=UPI00345BB12E
MFFFTKDSRRIRNSILIDIWYIKYTIGFCLLATIPPAPADNCPVSTVNTVNDLIQAINSANTSNVCLITIQKGNYLISDSIKTDSGEEIGLPEITSNITIQGAGTDVTTITTNLQNLRAINIAESGNLTIRDVKLTGFMGHSGAAINNKGQLTLSNILISDNSNDDNGGGIYNENKLTINDSIFSNNTATCGGGIYSASGKMIISNTKFESNTLDDGDCAGGAIFNKNTDATLIKVLILDNYNPSIRFNPGYGGGIYNDGSMTIIDATISRNDQDKGGGIYNDGKLILNNSTVTDNFASHGGGIFNDGNLTMLNTTVSKNIASGGSGGGIANLNTVLINNGTIAQNQCIDCNNDDSSPFPLPGGGIANRDEGVQVKNTIISNNTSDTGSTGNCSAPIISNGYNLDSDGTCDLNQPGDIANQDAKLGLLQDNMGPTFTHALLDGSPAIDAGDNNGCPSRDQRGAIRPQDGDGDHEVKCDIGAYEAGVLTDLDKVQVNGDANKDLPFIRLTSDEPSKAGSAFLPTVFALTPTSVIHTRFSFQIGGIYSDGPLGSDGLAFVMHNDPRGPTAVGNSGEGLGFGINETGDNPVNPIAPSIAIEFDTHRNAFPLHFSPDPDGNHIALINNGEIFNHLAYDTPALSLNDGSIRYVWLDYVGVSKHLEVFMAASEVKPAAPIISTTVDLSSSLGNKVYFGFTAGTGGGFNRHDILSWKLNFVFSPAIGDFNGDSCVDQADLITLLAVINGTGNKPLTYDLNGDGKVNIADSRKLVTLFTRPRGNACF